MWPGTARRKVVSVRCEQNQAQSQNPHLGRIQPRLCEHKSGCSHDAASGNIQSSHAPFDTVRVEEIGAYNVNVWSPAVHRSGQTVENIQMKTGEENPWSFPPRESKRRRKGPRWKKKYPSTDSKAATWNCGVFPQSPRNSSFILMPATHL